MKTYREILKDLIADFTSAQSKVTYFGKDGVARALFHSVANTLNDIWNDVYQSKRKMQVETSEGADLDLVGQRHGLTRKGATKSSVILLFNGTAGTVIPAGTEVKSPIDNVTYVTTQEITLGGQNPNINRPVYSNSIGDVVLAESSVEGSYTKVGVNTLTELVNPIAGVDSVTNLVASEGGLDQETDEQFRYRIMHNVSLLSHGTDDFYREMAREANPTVLRSYVKYNPLNTGVGIYVVKDSGALYSQAELDAIAAYVYERQRALQPVAVYNANFKEIRVYFEGIIGTTKTEAEILNDLSTRLSEYIDWSVLEWGAVLRFKEFSRIILDTEGIVEVKLTTIKVNDSRTDIECGSYELPRLIKLSFNSTELPITQQFIRMP